MALLRRQQAYGSESAATTCSTPKSPTSLTHECPMFGLGKDN